MAQAMTWSSLQDNVRSYIQRGKSLVDDPLVFEQIPFAIGLAERRIARELKVDGFLAVVTSVFAAGTAVYAKPDRWRETVSINFGTGIGQLDVPSLTVAGDGYLNVPTVTVAGDGTGGEVAALMTGRRVDSLVVTNPGKNYTAATLAFASASGAGAAGTVTIGTAYNKRNFLLPRSYEYIRSFWPDDSKTDQPAFYGDYDYRHFILGPTPDRAYPFEMLYWELPVLLDDTAQTNWITEYAPNLLLYASLLEMAPYLKNDERIPTWQQMYDRTAQGLSGEDLRKIMDRATNRTEKS